MEATVAINETLLEQAFHVSGMKTAGEIVNSALEEFIKRKSKENILSVFNTVEYDPSYDYKKLRGKR
jgi:hypothetical protein